MREARSISALNIRGDVWLERLWNAAWAEERVREKRLKGAIRRLISVSRPLINADPNATAVLQTELIAVRENGMRFSTLQYSITEDPD